MAKAAVYNNGVLAGYLEKTGPEEYHFAYTDGYLANPANPSVSLTLPRSQPVYQSNVLFPFFAGLLAEGINKDIQCRLLHLDENDDFSRLLKTAGDDTIGAITIKEVES